jgi:hypothetical protein
MSKQAQSWFRHARDEVAAAVKIAKAACAAILKSAESK